MHNKENRFNHLVFVDLGVCLSLMNLCRSSDITKISNGIIDRNLTMAAGIHYFAEYTNNVSSAILTKFLSVS